MQPQPLDYARPTPRHKSSERRVFGWVVIGAWILCVAVWACGFMLIVDDRSRLQFPAALLAGFAMFVAVLLTAFHWLVLVPVLWFTNRKN